mgnify:CR=1 FL=1
MNVQVNQTVRNRESQVLDFLFFYLKEEMMLDIIVIGAGIIGSTVAYELSKYDKEVLVLEKNENAGMGVTGHNSAIVHSGVDPKDDTLKEKYNLMGSRMYEAYCKELGTPFHRIGAFIIAKNKEDSVHIDELIENGKKRNVFVERLTPEQAKKLEPNLPDDVYDVLDMPTTAIVDPMDIARKAIQKAQQNHVKVHYNEQVQAIRQIDGGFELMTDKNTYQTKAIVNAAGLYAPHIEQMVSKPTFSLVMRRGDYIVLGKEAMNIASRVLYPVPSALGKGVLIVPTVHDTVLVGPTAIEVDDPEDDAVTEEGIAEIKEKITSVIKSVPYEHEIGRLSGIRPKEKEDDFIIEESKHVPFFFNLAGIDSPGIASAPAIATDFVHRILNERLGLDK